jgi:hypothetical protein
MQLLLIISCKQQPYRQQTPQQTNTLQSQYTATSVASRPTKPTTKAVDARVAQNMPMVDSVPDELTTKTIPKEVVSNKPQLLVSCANKGLQHDNGLVRSIESKEELSLDHPFSSWNIADISVQSSESVDTSWHKFGTAFGSSSSEHAVDLPEPLPQHPFGFRPPADKDPVERWAKIFGEYGRFVIQRGQYYLRRMQFLHEVCNRDDAPDELCHIYRHAQQMFAANYQAEPQHYRGYMMFHRDHRQRISRDLINWHRQIANRRYLPHRDGCHLADGLFSNCMSFALCSHKLALRDWSGFWGEGFAFPIWGQVNYWMAQAFYALLDDYKVDGQVRQGVRSLFRDLPTLDQPTRQKRTRILLGDIFERYLQIASRKLTPERHVSFANAFCANMIVDAGSFKRAIPGDIFSVTYLQRSAAHKQSTPRFRFQHWGLILDPKAGAIIHNQTPGGVWGSQYLRWGIQYDTYRNTAHLRTWSKRKQGNLLEKRITFVHRINLHYLFYARLQEGDIFTGEHPSLCRDWIAKYADIYFADFAARLKHGGSIGSK